MKEEFKMFDLDISAYSVLKDYLQYNEYPCCDLAPANPVLWGKLYKTRYMILNQQLVFCRMEDEKLVQVTFPIGDGDKKVTFDMLREYFSQQGLPFSLYLVSEEQAKQIEDWYPGKYKVSYNRDYADYLYETETLAKLAGKKLHGKRNHINRFLENYPNYQYEVISEKNREECVALSNNWLQDASNEDMEEKIYENNIIEYALYHMDLLNLKGALIRVDGKAIAFTIGEELTKDTFVVHFEKAYADIQGAYTMINREFVQRELLGTYTYVNREEDLGIPGLRHAKTSYQPVRLIEKGIVSEV